MMEAVDILAGARLLDARRHGALFEPPLSHVDAHIAAPPGTRELRVWVLSAAEGGEVTGVVDGAPLPAVKGKGLARYFDVDGGPSLAVSVDDPEGIHAVWVVPRLSRVPPELLPPRRDAGIDKE
jgi:hypothetical protein